MFKCYVDLLTLLASLVVQTSLRSGSGNSPRAHLGAPNVYAQMCCIYTCTTRFARSANLTSLGQSKGPAHPWERLMYNNSYVGNGPKSLNSKFHQNPFKNARCARIFILFKTYLSDFHALRARKFFQNQKRLCAIVLRA